MYITEEEKIRLSHELKKSASLLDAQRVQALKICDNPEDFVEDLEETLLEMGINIK